MTNKEAIEFASKNSFLALYEKGIAEGKKELALAFEKECDLMVENGLVDMSIHTACVQGHCIGAVKRLANLED